MAVNAVVVEADAFKEKDVLYQALMAENVEKVSTISQLVSIGCLLPIMFSCVEHQFGCFPYLLHQVHESSTTAASALLVTALNDGRDVIFDGTMSWAPFIEQTITMARNVHEAQYRMGPGYKKLPDGTVIEKYWEKVEESEVGLESPFSSRKDSNARRPYRIEMVGVVCDAHLAVMRGMRCVTADTLTHNYEQC